MTWNNPPFRMWTLGAYEKTEEVPSDRTVQNCSVQPVNKSKYHVAKEAT